MNFYPFPRPESPQTPVTTLRGIPTRPRYQRLPATAFSEQARSLLYTTAKSEALCMDTTANGKAALRT